LRLSKRQREIWPSIGRCGLIAFLLPGVPLDAQYPNNLSRTTFTGQ